MSRIVLIVTPQLAVFDTACDFARKCGFPCETRRVNQAALALARISGGGIDAVILDISGNQTRAAMMASVREFRAAAPHVPTILWCDSDAAGRNEITSESGALGWLTNDSSPQEMYRLLACTQDNAHIREQSSKQRPPPKATILAVMGVRGGVGTTTAAVNLGAALASRGTVVLSEIGPLFGGLQSCLHPGRMIRGFPSRADGAALSTRAVRTQLWPVPNTAGFHVLFGPQFPQDCAEIPAATAADLLGILAAEADFLVLDLPTSLSAANRELIGACHYLVLVLEPVQACLRLGNLLLESIQRWEKLPGSIATLVVKRDAEGAPIPQERIEAELGLPILGVIPPAHGLCARGERTGVPMIQDDSHGLVADSFLAVASRFPLQARPRAAGPVLPTVLRATGPEPNNGYLGKTDRLRN